MDFILKWMMSSVAGCFSGLFDLITTMSADLFDQPLIKSILALMQTIGLPLVAVAMMSLTIKKMIDYADGETFSIIDIMKRFVCGIVFYLYGVTIMQSLYLVLLDVGKKILSVISGMALDDFDFQFGAILQGFSAFLSLILLAIALYNIIKTFLNLIERTWHVLILLCMLYSYLPGYIMGNDEAIISWFKQTVAVALTQLFQTLLVITGLVLITNVGSLSDFLIGIGAILASAKVEQILDKYGNSAGGKLGNVARNGMSMAFYASSILKKG